MTQAKCKCGYVGEFTGYSQREIDTTEDNGQTWGTVIEIGIECPQCKKWFHSHYLTPKLLKMQEQLKKKQRQSFFIRYQREFKKVQEALRAKLGVEGPKFEKAVADENNKAHA